MSSSFWGCLVAVSLLLTVLGFGCAYSTGYLPIRPFDAETWRRQNHLNTSVRQSMVEWLVRSGRLDGLTRAEVLELLGPPNNEEGYFTDEWDLVYYLGNPARGLLTIDSEWLVIRFGRDDRVSEYRVVED